MQFSANIRVRVNSVTCIIRTRQNLNKQRALHGIICVYTKYFTSTKGKDQQNIIHEYKIISDYPRIHFDYGQDKIIQLHSSKENFSLIIALAIQ